MPRRARLTIPGIPHHVIQRGNNRSPCFFSDKDYRFYLQCLREGAERYQCAIHAYVLMPNHVHLLVSPDTEDGLSRLMRYLGSCYVQYVNNVYRRTGTLWEGRFKSNLVHGERFALTCYRYIELNPVRARLVPGPKDYRWSSHASHAYGQEDVLIRDHRAYLELGATHSARADTYRELFRDPLGDEVINEIRTAVNGGLVLGGDEFKDEIERLWARRVRPGRGGRPRKAQRGHAAVGYIFELEKK